MTNPLHGLLDRPLAIRRRAVRAYPGTSFRVPAYSR